MTRPHLLLAATLAVAACATTPKTPADSLPACPTGRAPDGWHLVTTERLTLCVPGEWRSAGPRSWRGDGGQLTWGWGARPRQVSSATVTVRGDRPLQSQIEAQLPVKLLRHTTETVGSHRVELWLTEDRGEYHVVAEWQAGSSLYMTGDATRRATAEAQLNVVRTVRLAGS